MLLRLDGVTRRFGERVLFQDVSLEVRAGDRIGLVGPNGAGKTTLVKIAASLELPDDGRRYIDEETDWNYDPFGGAEKNQKPCVTVEEFMNQYLNR